jgi:DNA polymerase III delta subunit
MSEPQLILIFGDPFRCEQSLAARHARILEEDPETERHTLFGDELDLPTLKVELQSASLFTTARHFVVRHAEAIKARPFSALIERDLPSGTYLTFLSTGLKGTSPLVKAARKRGSVQALPPIKGKALERTASELIASQGVHLDPQGLKELITRSGGDLLTLYQEARKLRSFSQEGMIDRDTVEGVVFTSGEESIYPLLDRIGERDLQATLQILSTLHEDEGRVLAGVVRHLTKLLMVRVLLDSKVAEAKIASIVGSPSWLVRRLVAQAKGHQTQKLTAALDLGIDLDLEVKRGGIRPSDALLRLILYVTTSSLPSPGYARQSRLSPTATG